MEKRALNQSKQTTPKEGGSIVEIISGMGIVVRCFAETFI